MEIDFYVFVSKALARVNLGETEIHTLLVPLSKRVTWVVKSVNKKLKSLGTKYMKVSL